MLMRFDPFRDLDRLTQNLWGGDVRRLNGVPMDAYRKGDEFFVHFDVPGIDPRRSSSRWRRTCSPSAPSAPASGATTSEVVVNERPVGSFSRQLFLGETLDADRIEATCENGVLTLAHPGRRGGQAPQGRDRPRQRRSRSRPGPRLGLIHPA